MYCQKCGSPNVEGASFCTQCGAPIDGAQNAQQAQKTECAAPNAAQESGTNNEGTGGWGGYAGGLSPDEEQLIGQKLEYYAPRFAQMRTGGKASWNWCSFFIFPAWAIYRKMYRECVVYLVATQVLTIALGNIYPNLLISILLGLFGNYLYLRSVSGHAVAMASMPQVQKDAYAVKFGGVSSTNVGLLILALAIWGLVQELLGIG